MEFLASLEALGRELPGGAGFPGVWLGLLAACGVGFVLLLSCLAAYRVRVPPRPPLPPAPPTSPPPLPHPPHRPATARYGADRELGGH